MQTIYKITDVVWMIVTAVSLLVWIIDKIIQRKRKL